MMRGWIVTKTLIAGVLCLQLMDASGLWIANGMDISGARITALCILMAQLKLKLAMDDRVTSINYSVDTVSGVVYLFGIAQDSAELDRVTYHARNMDYVLKVVNHVWLKTDPRRKTGDS